MIVQIPVNEFLELAEEIGAVESKRFEGEKEWFDALEEVDTSKEVVWEIEDEPEEMFYNLETKDQAEVLARLINNVDPTVWNEAKKYFLPDLGLTF